MLNKMFGTKGNMTSAYQGEKRFVVTKISIPTLSVTQLKNTDKDGYQAIQVAFGEPRRHTSKALKGHLKSLKKPLKHVKEVRDLKEDAAPQLGDLITLEDLLELGDILSIQGTTKGKGFTGVIKRWGFSRQPKTHGQSDRVRAPGSIGQTTEIGRVFKGKKMAGRHGSLTRSVKNSLVLHLDPEKQEIWVSGHVPGNTGGLITLTLTGHKDIPHLTGMEPEPEEPAEKSDSTTQEPVSEKVEKAPAKSEEKPAKEAKPTKEEKPAKKEAKPSAKKEEKKKD